jgi:2-polyprenyl-6-hydroxyphenyl methylase/3-demethylubiquinone-9 3-methyltransferase
MPDVVAWHSDIAKEFDGRYKSSRQFIERLEVWNAIIRAYTTPDSDVLDAGCGSGALSEVAAHHARKVLGFDASPEMIALAVSRRDKMGLDNLTVKVAKLGDASVLSNARFDLVLCSSVLEYIDDYWGAIDWLASALKPNGVLVFSMPNAASFYRTAERTIYRLTGRPAYYAYVRHVPYIVDIHAGLAARSMQTLDVKYYASVPVLSPLAEACGRPELACNLFAIACRTQMAAS